MTRRARTPWRLGLAAGLAVFLALAGSLGAAALWTTANRSLPATANAASISATLSSPSPTQAGEWKWAGNSSPLRISLLTYKNTGTAPIAVSLGVTSTVPAGQSRQLETSTEVSVWTPSGACGSTVPSGSASGTLASPPALPVLFSTVAAGATVLLCVATRITGTTLSTVQGQSVTPTFTLSGRVGTNWSTAAGTTFTQSVFRVSAPATPTCANSGNTSVILTWPAVTDASEYKVYRQDGQAVDKQVLATSPTVSVTLAPSDLGYLLTVGAPTTNTVAVETRDVYGGWSSARASYPVHVSNVLLGLLVPRLRCA